MTLQSSGAISLSQIKTELGSGSNSLRALSAAAGKSAPDAFSEFYGYSATDNLGVITTGNHSVTSSGKFATTTFYYGYDIGTGYFSGNMTLGSSSNNDFELSSGATFTIRNLISVVGIISSNHMVISGNYDGQTLQQATGFRYLKSGSSIIMDSTQYNITGDTMYGYYNAGYGGTSFVYSVVAGGTGFAQSTTVPQTAGTTMNLYWSN